MAPPGARVLAVQVGGAPLDEARAYRLATNDFLAAGGDGYTVLARHQTVFAEPVLWLRDLVADWWRSQGAVGQRNDGRIRAVTKSVAATP